MSDEPFNSELQQPASPPTTGGPPAEVTPSECCTFHSLLRYRRCLLVVSAAHQRNDAGRTVLCSPHADQAIGILLTTSAKQFQPRRETACLLLILVVHKDRENIFHRLIRRHYLPDVSPSSPEAYNRQLPHNLSGAHTRRHPQEAAIGSKGPYRRVGTVNSPGFFEAQICALYSISRVHPHARERITKSI